MAKFDRIKVASTMRNTGFVPLFYHPDIDLGKKVLKACYEGGARVIEFISRGDNALEVFTELNKYAGKELPELILGVGSPTTGAEATLYMQAGANFVVTPVFRKDIAITCNRKKVLWSPGCGSLSEIATAEEYGCEIVKLFPGGIYGPAFIKAIKGPCPWTHVMPTGGVSPDPENLKGWFDAGAFCVGMGSKLISKDIIQSKNMDLLRERVKETVAIIKQVR